MPAVKKLMAPTILKPLWAAIASIATFNVVIAVQPAHAFSVTYNFTVQITNDAYEAQGLLNGMTEQGSFTYDTDGLTSYDPDGLTETRDQYVSASKGNLTLIFRFLNNIYTEKSDLNYGSKRYDPDYPAALFTDGKLVGLDFLVAPSQFQPPQNDLGFRIYKDAFYVGAVDNSNSVTLSGAVTYDLVGATPAPPKPSPAAAAVPEPSEVGGTIAALSLLGIGAIRVRGQKR